jgi:hypothetical protein
LTHGLPRLVLPDRMLLLHEEFVAADLDRTGNSRFYFRDDGAFFHSRNRELWVPPDRADDDDPALHFNREFAAQPDATLDGPRLQELIGAIESADFPALDPCYAPAMPARVSHPVVERFTAASDGDVRTVIVEQRAHPPALRTLRATIDRLVEAALDG